MPLPEIESINIIQRQRTRQGAWLGALAGLVAITVSYSDCFGYACELSNSDLAKIFAGGAVLGAGFGALVGMAFVEWVHFVP